MGKKRSTKDSASSIPKAIGLSLIISTITTVLGVVVGAYLIYKEIIVQESTGIVVTAVLTLSSALGAVTATLTAKRVKLQMSLLSGVSYYLMLLCMTALFFDGQYNGILATAFAILTGCGAVVLLNIIPKKRGKSFKIKTAYR